MKEFKGTPGEWSVNPNEQYYDGSKAFEVNFDRDGECVAEVIHGKENAQLISAAPDLLDACMKMKQALDKINPEELTPEYTAMCIAIDKATGEPI